jgi:hypothetical protein
MVLQIMQPRLGGSCAMDPSVALAKPLGFRGDVSLLEHFPLTVQEQKSNILPVLNAFNTPVSVRQGASHGASQFPSFDPL